MRHGDVVLHQDGDVAVLGPDGVCGQDPAVEHAVACQQLWGAGAVALAYHGTLGLGFGEMDLQQRIAPPGFGGDGGQPLGRHGVRRVRAEPDAQPLLLTLHLVPEPARTLEQRFPGAAGPGHVEDGRGVDGTDAGVEQAPGPPRPDGGTARSSWSRRCPAIPPRPGPCPSRRPRLASGPRAGQTDSASQRSSGSPSPALRTRVMGEWLWQLTRPGMRIPPSSSTSVAGSAASCHGSPTQVMRALVHLDRPPGASTRSSSSTAKTASATRRWVTAPRRTAGRRAPRRRGWDSHPRPSPPWCRRRRGRRPGPRRPE